MQKSVKLTKFELEVMEAIWRLGSGSIREILESIPGKDNPAYTTIQTIVNRLEEKGAVRRVKKIGNAHIFEPLISRKAEHHRLIIEFLDLFGGSARPLIAHLAESGKLSLEDLKVIETMLKKQGQGSEREDRNSTDSV